MAMKVKGGVTYLDFSGFGQFTSGTAKDYTDTTIFDKTQQMDKPVILVGLDLKTVGKFGATVLSFVSTTASNVTTATAVTPAFTVAITSAGKVTVTKAS